MRIELAPEIAAMIEEDLRRGRCSSPYSSPYSSVEESIAQAVALLHGQEKWLAAERGGIFEKIEHAVLQAERGELIPEEAAFAELARRHEVRRRGRA